MLTVPNIQNITNASNGYDMQCWEDQTDNYAFLQALQGTYVVSGMAVTPSSGMTVAVAAGYFCINGTVYSYAGGTVAVGANSGVSGDRRDIVTINTSGTLTVTAGTACGTAGWVRTTNALPPVKPSIPANQVLLGEVSVIGSVTTTVASANIVDKTTIGAGAPGALLARAQYAPSAAHTYTVINIATGITALDSTNLVVTFIAPPSGNVLVELVGWVVGAATVGTIILGVVSTTSSPGTLVGVSGLAYNSSTTTAADNKGIAYMKQLFTGLTAGTAYTWYMGAAYGTAVHTMVAQGATTNTTVPTGAPFSITVTAA